MTPTPAHEPPTNHEITREADPDRKALLGAMQRILNGTPTTVSRGATRFSDLAAEAGLKRFVLYQHHPDLKDRFEHLRDHAQRPTDREEKLQGDLADAARRIADLEQRLAAELERRDNWKGLAELLANAVATLQADAEQQRTRADRLARKLDQAGSSANVIPMPSR